MTPDEIEDVSYVIENEGFEYAFLHYTSFSDVKDEEFHKLRRKYIKAHYDLLNYINSEED